MPRTDLATTFLTGITGVNKPATRDAVGDAAPEHRDRAGAVRAARTGSAIVGSLKTRRPAATSPAIPNGRRPKDDVVDISLVAVMGGLCMANGDNDA